MNSNSPIGDHRAPIERARLTMDAMTRPQDAPLLASLEHQYYELAVLLARVERMRTDLASAEPATWHGAAKRAFSLGVYGVTTALDASEAALRSARGNTGVAIMQVSARV